jgi:tRNA(Ser,Leu) C12 N-acetylase TAN1
LIGEPQRNRACSLYDLNANVNSDNPAQNWVINVSILASLTGSFRPAIKKFVENQALLY